MGIVQSGGPALASSKGHGCWPPPLTRAPRAPAPFLHNRTPPPLPPSSGTCTDWSSLSSRSWGSWSARGWVLHARDTRRLLVLPLRVPPLATCFKLLFCTPGCSCCDARCVFLCARLLPVVPAGGGDGGAHVPAGHLPAAARQPRRAGRHLQQARAEVWRCHCDAAMLQLTACSK